MKHTKEFFGVLFSILICVFLVGLGVSAVTTIGSDISIDDDLTVTDDAIVNGLASISETLRVPTLYGNTDAGLYLRVGDQALTSHSLNAQDDLLITGDLEVDGTAFFDGNVSLSDTGILRTSFIYGHMDAGQYLSVGNAGTTGHSLNTEDDLLITGDMEVDGTAFFDGSVSVSESFIMSGDDANIVFTFTSMNGASEATSAMSSGTDADGAIRVIIDGGIYYIPVFEDANMVWD